jgi:phage baseplate assembly protein W|tara:strand:- start:118 stop:519 length:402 start_codon:yes stop_codon:yes gene_type:complete
MPLERVSKGFKDLSLSFKLNPINLDLIAIKNETAIARSIRNLVLTYPGERFFNPYLGSKVSRSLFENIDAGTASIIKEEIELTIENYEPRVEVIKIEVNPDYDNNTFNVIIEYNIIGVELDPQQLSFALQPTR